MALVAAAAARLPQPVDQEDLERRSGPPYGTCYLRPERHDDVAQSQEPSPSAPTGAPQVEALAPRANSHVGTYYTKGSRAPSTPADGRNALLHTLHPMLNLEMRFDFKKSGKWKCAFIVCSISTTNAPRTRLYVHAKVATTVFLWSVGLLRVCTGGGRRCAVTKQLLWDFVGRSL